MEKKRVTVIIPVYNQVQLVGRCFDSLLAQSSRDFQAILVDDGSTDGSADVVASYARKYPEVFTALFPGHGGVCAARNAGLDAADTEFVMFVDCDDYLDPDYVATFLSAAPGKDLVYGGFRRITPGEKTWEARPGNGPWSRYLYPTPWSRLYRRAFLIDHGLRYADMAIGEDTVLTFRAYQYRPRMKYVDYVGYNYYFSHSSINSTRDRGDVHPGDLLPTLVAVWETMDQPLKPLDRYFLFRYVVWYHLHFRRVLQPAETARLRKWLRKKGITGPGLPWYSSRLRGDFLKNRLAVAAYALLWFR